MLSVKQELMELPETETIRKRIEKTKDETIKNLFKLEYLGCARISELVAKKCPSQTHTKVYGVRGSFAKKATYHKGKERHDVAVFSIPTAKHNGSIRQIALPLEKKYEPFAESLLGYIQEFGDDYVFPITAQQAYVMSKELFDGLTYPIEEYRKTKLLPYIPKHMKDFRTHALRHVRASELIDVFDFNAPELSLYGGWSLRGLTGASSALSRYTHLQWKKYFPKLLVEGLY